MVGIISFVLHISSSYVQQQAMKKWNTSAIANTYKQTFLKSLDVDDNGKKG
jgi:hypothetical protein